MRTPIFKFPFCVHHNKYIESKAKTAVERKAIPADSNPVKTEFKKELVGNPY